MKLNGAEAVSYNAGILTAWYPTYHVCEKSKVEQAFKILGKLLEQKIIERELTVKEFMKMVNDIAEII